VGRRLPAAPKSDISERMPGDGGGCDMVGCGDGESKTTLEVREA
jgi:hypothetical protein